jgi:transcriptional regulator with XRE-family HTH domain
MVVRLKRTQKGERFRVSFVKFNLDAARVNAGLSQKEAADSLGISNKTLCSWENYLTFPGADMIPKICELYGIPYDQINFAKRFA